MATSQELLGQLQQYSTGNIPGEIESAIKKAYEPTITSLINEGNALRPKAYTGFFDAAQKYGTGAGDLSPAARLSAMIGEGELAMQPYRNNMDIRNYYGTSINDMVGKGLQAYQTGYGNLRDMYGTLYQREMDAQQMAEQRAARASQESAAAQQAQMLRDYYNKYNQTVDNTMGASAVNGRGNYVPVAISPNRGLYSDNSITGRMKEGVAAYKDSYNRGGIPGVGMDIANRFTPRIPGITVNPLTYSKDLISMFRR